MNGKNIDLTAYPFLREESSLVNHKILIDVLSSSLGRIIASKTPLEKEPWRLMDEVLHLNVSIRGKMAITQRNIEEIGFISKSY